VARIEVVNPSLVPDREIRQLFGLAPGDVYEIRRVQGGLLRLAQKAGVRDVIVRGTLEGHLVALELEVVPEPLVRSVRVRGNRALRDAALRGRLETRVDRPLRESVLARDVDALRELYESEGFPAAQVRHRAEPVGDGLWLRLVLEIDEGAPQRILRIEGTEALEEPGDDGVPPMERPRLVALLGLREGSPASRRQLRDGVRRVVDVLHREGYPEARIGRAGFRAEGEGAVLSLPVSVGEAIDVRVEDVDEWAAEPLREIARGRFGEPLDDHWIERTAELMAEYLRSQGYYHASVEAEDTRAYGRRRIVFRTERGPRVRVAEVAFEGNENISSASLRQYLSLVVGGIVRPPPFTQEALNRDLQVVADYYASRGYPEARVEVAGLTVSSGGKAALRLRVDEGRLYRLGEVSLDGNGALDLAELRAVAALRPGAPADPGELREARLRILRELERRGHPEADVALEVERDAEAGLVHPTYRIRSGPLVRFGETVVSGNARTQTKVIQRELTFRNGDLWDPQEVLRSRQRLYRLGFFQRVRIEPLTRDEGDEVRDAWVEVEEQDAGSVTLGLGYGTEEGVKGSAAISHANLWGSGRSLGFRYDRDQLDRSWAVNFREPWLLGRRLELGLTLVKSYQNREAYNLSSLGFQASLEREFGEHVRGSLFYTLEDNVLSDVVDEAVVGQDQINAYILSAVGPVLVWDSRDDPFNPRRGYHHTFQVEWASSAFGSDVEYERYLGSVSGFFTAGRVTLALLARGGIAVRLGSAADLPVNKRFFLGGRSTLRGFQRDEAGPKAADGTPVGGDVMGNLKAELRFPLWKQLGGAVFWDAGNVWNRTPGFPGSSGIRQGAGGGLRYLTPVGPLSLDLGFNLDPQAGEDAWVWYFTIGNVF
jgi:outer membrane protein insertion porin family